MRARSVCLVFAAALAFAGCDPKRPDSGQPPAPATAGPRAAEPVVLPGVRTEADKWFDASHGMWLKAGQFAVQVAAVDVRPVELRSFGAPTSRERCTVVKLSIYNRHPNRKAEYHSWADAGRLTDEFDNHYKRLAFGAPIVGAVEGSVSIFPGKIIADVLVFEPPVAAASTLFLELPGDNLGAADSAFYLRIPLDRPAAAKVVPTRPVSKKQAPTEVKQPAPASIEPPAIGYGPFHAGVDGLARALAELERLRKERERAEAERRAKLAHDEVEAQKLYEKVTARIHLLELIEKFPNTRAAAKAKQRLDELDKK